VVEVQLAHYLGFLHRSQLDLAQAFREVGEGHAEEADIFHISRTLAEQCDGHAERLRPFVERYGEEEAEEPDRLHSELFKGTREGPIGLLRDLHDLYLMAAEVDISWTLVAQAAQGARDSELLETVEACEEETATQMAWLKSRMKEAAPQALVVA
jgi:hypothetical protein